MEEELNISKGELMEEKLRRLFLSNGFFVVRGAKFLYDDYEITDVDLWLYNRPSFVSRERTIVDIKNKKTPQAIERIFWTKGLMEVLNADSCIVATTEKRHSVREFGRLNGVTVLDGEFLKRLPGPYEERMSEELFLSQLRAIGSYALVNDFPKRYENMKRSLLGKLDFSNLNNLLSESKYFYEQCLVNPPRRHLACRLLYCAISFILINLDFIMKDLSTLDEVDRKRRLDEGLKFGSTGRNGIEKTLDLAIKLAAQQSSKKQEFIKIYDAIPSEILVEFFSKFENSNKVFKQAKYFESAAFRKDFISPLALDAELRGIISILLDFHGIERKRFFDCF